MKDIVQTDTAPRRSVPIHKRLRPVVFSLSPGKFPLIPSRAVRSWRHSRTDRSVLKNLSALLVAGGSGLDRVVKATVFLADMNEFGAMNQVYGQ